MSRKKFLILSLMFMLVIVFIFAFTFMKSRDLQKDTCKRTIEYSFSVLLGQDSNKKASLKTEWEKLDLRERSRLFKYANENTYTECKEFPYLITGNESDGSELIIYVRRAKSNDAIEVMLDK